MNGPPKPPGPHVPGIYRYTATALGAGMWFWVSPEMRALFQTRQYTNPWEQLMYRAKKDGKYHLSHRRARVRSNRAEVLTHNDRSRLDGLEAPLGSLDWHWGRRSWGTKTVHITVDRNNRITTHRLFVYQPERISTIVNSRQ